MRKLLLIVAAVIVFAAFYWAYGPKSARPVSTVAYACDGGKAITAAYFDGGSGPEAAPGQPPRPTGWVEVSIGGAPTTTLRQTISADGTRYSDGDPNVEGSERLVFWSKGNTALVLRDNAMDLDYTNCETRP